MATFVDIDLSFGRHPGTKDILKRTDVEAVKQAIKNIFMTNAFEKPFNPHYGMGANAFMFENITPVFQVVLRRRLEDQIMAYEPRVVIENISIEVNDDMNDVNISLDFYVVGNNTKQKLNFVLERTR